VRNYKGEKLGKKEMSKNRYLVKPMMAILQFNIGHFFVSISLYNMLQNSIVCVSSSEAMKTANSSREKWTS
jgi:hypothetical protein